MERLIQYEDEERLQQDRRKLRQWQREINSNWIKNVTQWTIEYISENDLDIKEIELIKDFAGYIQLKGFMFKG
ncbi:MAG: hypothetical protein N3D74_06745, partial [Caldisericia bacterium]|nr:hypothetical protein [Caldisericia bacterium]